MLLRDGPAEQRDLLAPPRILLEEPPQNREPVVGLVAAKLHVGDDEQQLGIVAGCFGGEVLRRGGDVAAGDQLARELDAQLGLVGVGGGRMLQRVERALRIAGGLLRRGDHAQLPERGRALPRPRVVGGAEVDVVQLLADLLVVGIEGRGLAQRFHRLRRAPFLGELGRDVLEIAERAALVAHLDARGHGGEAGLVVLGIERSDADLRLQRAALVAARVAQLDQGVQVRARVGVEPLHREDVGDLQQRVLVIRFELEDLLVERAGLRHLAFVAQVVGDLDELLDGLLRLAGAAEEIAERVLGGPVLRLILDDAHVLRDGSVDLALPDQFLGIPERGRAINGHGDQSIVSNRVGGRNERRCASE